MGKRLTQDEIEALRLTVPHAQVTDIFVVERPPTPTGVEDLEDVAAYLEHFAVPMRDADGKPTQECLACHETHTFRWGLTHGTGHCNHCGWPATLYHFIKDRNGADLVTIRGVLLQAHPDDISVCKKTG